MDESGFELQIVYLRLPPEVCGASAFYGGKHFVFINETLPEELQTEAREKEIHRKK